LNFVVTYTNLLGYILDSIYINGMYSARATADSTSQYTFNNVRADSAIKVVYKIRTYTITSSAGNGGKIAPQGTSTVHYGSTPSYTITPNTGYIIESIIINGNKVANVNNYIFDSVKADQTIRAVFKLQTFSITATDGEGGSISPKGVIIVNYGSTPRYIITPNTAYVIDSITINGNKIANVNNLTLDSVKENLIISVKFKSQYITITSLAGTGGNISPKGVINVNYGDRPTYIITPNTGYIIDSLLLNNTRININNNKYTFDSVKANQIIRVAFKLQTYTITAIAGNGGSIAPQGTSTVHYGDRPSYTITPNTGYLIDSVLVHNTTVNSINNNYIFDSIKADQTIRVVFKLQTFTITSSAGNGGSISYAGDSIVNYGSNLSVTITPNTGYYIDSLLIDEIVQSNKNSYTFSNITANHRIRVTFKLIQFIITGFVNASQGRISTIQDTVNYGSNIRVTYQANSGYNLAYILIDNNIIQYDSLVGYTFTNVTQNHNITPFFTYITIPNPPTNIIAVGGNGQATVSFTAPVNNGGAAINKYNISTTTGNITASGIGSPIIVTGLGNGIHYRFVVKAINAIGSSLNSDSSNAITSSASGKYINTMVVGGQITATSFIDSGANITITYINNTGYVLDSIYINGMYSARATADSIIQYTF
ncbi:MAG: fibronectin type III domain-containing protein, partial [Sediminibacterium sp.]|nr:fibronectin type III domain-containing protein [Sediminibacterium sp.]